MSDQFQTEALWKTLLDLAESDSRDSNVIPHLRIILEGIYKAATSSLPTSFSNLFSRMQYLHKQEGFPFELAAQASLMRILCNCVLHDGQVASPAEVLSCYLVLTRLLTHFFPQKAAPGLLAWLEKHKAVPFAEQSRTDLSSFSCVVNNWSLSNADQPPALNIIAFDEYGQECSILLCPGSSEGKNWLLLNKTLWQNAYLTFHKLKPVQNRKGFYQSTPETLVVLEPDFLVDASALAECFAKEGSFPEHFVLSKLISEASTAKTATGKVVNSLFDELVLNPQADYDTLFRSALEHQPISLLALGIQTTLKIHDEIKTNHFPQLQKIAALYKDSGLQLEPSFIAPGYGLQGRLDLLANQHGKYQIIELKSGKSPSYDVWKTQQMQVVAYNLIIKASLGQKNLSSSSIFYSEHAKNPLRNVVNSSLLEQELLMCRNRIVGILHRLTDDPSFFFDWIKTRQENYPNPILQNRFETCQGILAQLSELEYQWFLTQVRWLMKEIWQAKVGGTGTENGIYGYNRLWRKANSIKLNDYELMKDLLLTRVECNTISLAIQPSPDQSIPSENSISNFRQA
ncbi:MAG: PD-(D/E)XK nuclease family protein, partial [Candidatus Cloacimonetes bacterium]|nr:PD-(D/E)XK nuclease family protein [Candidatus Cloacimonadota bacterium]